MICWGGEFDFPSLKIDLQKLKLESENPEIWKDPSAKSLFQKIKNIENKIRDFETIESNIEYFKEFLSLAISENNEEYFDQLLEESKKIIEAKYNELNYSNLSTDSDIAKISVVGMGMMSQSGVAEKMFTTLAKNKINIQAISTSEIKISVLIKKIYTDLAIQSLHDVYKLNKK